MEGIAQSLSCSVGLAPGPATWVTIELKNEKSSRHGERRDGVVEPSEFCSLCPQRHSRSGYRIDVVTFKYETYRETLTRDSERRHIHELGRAHHWI